MQIVEKAISNWQFVWNMIEWSFGLAARSRAVARWKIYLHSSSDSIGDISGIIFEVEVLYFYVLFIQKKGHLLLNANNNRENQVIRI